MISSFCGALVRLQYSQTKLIIHTLNPLSTKNNRGLKKNGRGIIRRALGKVFFAIPPSLAPNRLKVAPIAGSIRISSRPR